MSCLLLGYVIYLGNWDVLIFLVICFFPFGLLPTTSDIDELIIISLKNGNSEKSSLMCTSGNGDCVQLAPPTGRWSGLRTGLASQLPAGGLHPVASVFIFDWAETSSSSLSSLILFRRFS
ncbi:hypothetical protein T02_2896 [Trichinella nativa]|uniref:Uncharacterized protein n=1 Tax=Trichinella nativa TaxID=6335 RepID=A0A0V1KZA5_9BILA|nr:hypothetical protein T02_2896 [Trichinella nativa]